jgi:hypothetical protein
MRSGWLMVLSLGLVLLATVEASPAAERLVPYETAAFTMQVPQGWRVFVAGQCAELAVVTRDPARPLRQVFYFGSVGPFYAMAQRKQEDIFYMRSGGYPVPWAEMPVVEPLTPARFVEQFQHIASTNLARQFMPQAPRLAELQVISTRPLPSLIAGGTAALVRAVFLRQGQVGQGLFTCTLAPMPAMPGLPTAGLAYAYLFTGVTAPEDEFSRLLPTLTRSLGSLELAPAYVQQCRLASQAAFASVMRAGQTLRETSDMIMQGWQRRNRSEDVMAEKRSDAILGYERVYDPATGETFQVEPDFWDRYQLNRQRFQMNDLRPVPNDRHDLWTRAPRSQRDIR